MNGCSSDSYHAEAAHLLGMFIGICAVRQVARVVAMNDVIDPVLVEEGFQKVRGQIIGHSCAQRLP